MTDYLIRYDLRRAASIKPEGIALFHILDGVKANEAYGTHLGSTDDYSAAERWVNGGAFPDRVEHKYATIGHPHDR